jgi:adenylosuccinate lyase
VAARLTESATYAHLWGTAEVRARFDEPARLQVWLDILVALADAQAELGIIPRRSADLIAEHATVEQLDLEYITAETRRTSHSTLGLIHGLQRILPADAAEHVYYGITVQDLTDTWMVLAARDVVRIAWRDLRHLVARLTDLAAQHRGTVMPGRTHAQPGAPITFGWKAAGWAAELARHLGRLRDGRDRWLVGQLGGAVGTLGFFGDQGPALRTAFCRRLGLHDPGVAWLTSRDRLAELGGVLAMITCTLARIGNEVMELQRPEVGELREPTTVSAVGSITMPHKRNPERSEHLDTLSRLARAQAGVLLEGMVQIHERDGRGWKAEWAAFPDLCLLVSTSLEAARELVDGLEVIAPRMRENMWAADGALASERVLSAAAAKVGKHRAQATLHELLRTSNAAGVSFVTAVESSGLLAAGELSSLLGESSTGTAVLDTDRVVVELRAFLAAEPEQWA